jgi:hypothetical protein
MAMSRQVLKWEGGLGMLFGGIENALMKDKQHNSVRYFKVESKVLSAVVRIMKALKEFSSHIRSIPMAKRLQQLKRKHFKDLTPEQKHGFDLLIAAFAK